MGAKLNKDEAHQLKVDFTLGLSQQIKETHNKSYFARCLHSS